MAGWGDDPTLAELRTLVYDDGWTPVSITEGTGSVDEVVVEKDGERKTFSSDHIAFHRFVEGSRRTSDCRFGLVADQAKFAELAMEHMSSLYSGALRMTRNPADPDRWAVVDGTRSPDDVAAAIWELISIRFPDLA